MIIGANQRLAEQRGVTILLVGPTGVGKTRQLPTLGLDRVVFCDVEAGDLSVQDVAVDTTRIADWPACRDLACRIGGPDPSYPPTACYSQAHYDAVGGALEGLDKKDIFFSTVSRRSAGWRSAGPNNRQKPSASVPARRMSAAPMGCLAARWSPL
jgi:AAA domain